MSALALTARMRSEPIVYSTYVVGSAALATERVKRRLAAILAADVVGYSRLMGADESGTLQALKAIKAELVDPTTAAYNGRLVKTTGDGLLVKFGSVVDALRCATEAKQKYFADCMVEESITALSHSLAFRHCSQFELHLQGSGDRCEAGRT